MTVRVLRAVVFATALASPAAAQLSSDIPGVPRALVSMRGGRQSRTEWILSGYHIPSSFDSTKSINAGGVHLGFGSSYRVRGKFEVGFDFTFVDLLAVFPPESDDASITTGEQYLRGMAGIGIRLGAKFRAVNVVDIEGNGYQVAVGGGWQPALKPLFGVDKYGDSTRTSGQFSGGDSDTSSYYPFNPFAKSSSSTMFAIMGSYRAKRIIADAAIVANNSADRDAADGPSPTAIIDNTALTLGGSFRITPSIAVGAAYWGKGAPPWRDESSMGAPGTRVRPKGALLIQFGSSPEAGVDLMLTSPTGSLGKSARLYIRARSTS